MMTYTSISKHDWFQPEYNQVGGHGALLMIKGM